MLIFVAIAVIGVALLLALAKKRDPLADVASLPGAQTKMVTGYFSEFDNPYVDGFEVLGPAEVRSMAVKNVSLPEVDRRIKEDLSGERGWSFLTAPNAIGLVAEKGRHPDGHADEMIIAAPLPAISSGRKELSCAVYEARSLSAWQVRWVKISHFGRVKFDQ